MPHIHHRYSIWKHSRDCLSYPICSLPHELLSGRLPDGGYRDDPSYVFAENNGRRLIADLLQGVPLEERKRMGEDDDRRDGFTVARLDLRVAVEILNKEYLSFPVEILNKEYL